MAISANALLKKKKAEGGGGNLLHGSDVPKNIRQFKVKVTDVREAPDNFNAAVILDIKEVYGCTAFAVNVTNLKALAAKYGDNLIKLRGKVIPLVVVPTNNPKTNTTTRGLRVDL